VSSGANAPKLNVLQVFMLWQETHKGHELTYGQSTKEGNTVGIFMCETCGEYKQMWVSETHIQEAKNKKPKIEII